ncbi:9190_t:CDS:2, partial [Gigaspora rosea]
SPIILCPIAMFGEAYFIPIAILNHYESLKRNLPRVINDITSIPGHI